MHECPICGEMCDCDGDDLFSSIIPDDCDHCDEYELEVEYFEYDEEASRKRNDPNVRLGEPEKEPL